MSTFWERSAHSVDVGLYDACFGVSFCTVSPSVCLGNIKLDLCS